LSEQIVPSRELIAVTALTGVAAFFAFAFFCLSLPFLPDSDSYFHLAVARLYADEGLVRALPWTRLSILGESFGDKDLLLHLFLIPFVTLTDPATGGRIALGALNALLAGTFCWLGGRAIGRWGYAVAPVMFLSAAPMIVRTARLRPEILSLIVLLLVIPLAARRRYLAVAGLAAVYTWSHLSFHMLPLLALLWFAWEFLRHRRLEWKLLAATFGGTVAGLLLHPHFPDNLRIWTIATLVLPRRMHLLDVGTEFQPPTLFTLSLGLGVAIAIPAFVLASRRSAGSRDDGTSVYYGIALLVFALLYARYDRMSIYVVTLAVMAVLFELGRRGRLAFRPAILISGLLVSIAAAVPSMTHVLRLITTQGASEADLERFGKAVPESARVAAQWGTTAYYSFWAPQGRYLNVLDPVLMEAFDPDRYQIQRAMFEGALPDPPLAAKRDLDSDFIAFHRSKQNAALFYRLTADPRIRIRYLGDNLLAEIVPSSRFVLEWELLKGRYPRLSGAGREVEGYVDLRRILGPDERCGTVTHRFDSPSPERRTFRFIAYGPAVVRAGEEIVYSTGIAETAILSRAIRLELEGGHDSISIHTCREGKTGHAGFYLIEE
jgi:hypothetical protein